MAGFVAIVLRALLLTLLGVAAGGVPGLLLLV
jgi:hypothetical protein